MMAENIHYFEDVFMLKLAKWNSYRIPLWMEVFTYMYLSGTTHSYYLESINLAVQYYDYDTHCASERAF